MHNDIGHFLCAYLHLDPFFGEKFIQTFYPFFGGIICFFLLLSYNSSLFVLDKNHFWVCD